MAMENYALFILVLLFKFIHMNMQCFRLAKGMLTYPYMHV